MQKNDPIIINVPHSSTLIPPEEAVYFTTPMLSHELAVMTDHYCDDLYDTGEKMLRFPVSRLVCDPERFRDDADEIMASVGMGAVYLACSDGSELKKITRDHKEEILSRYYDSYHRSFEKAVEGYIRMFGKCLIIDGHSFYDEPLPYESDRKTDRPDICIGTDDFHTPERIKDILCGFFAGKGYSVEVNRPFAGSIVPIRFYRKDARVMSVMIEINRRMYMGHDLQKTEGYERVKKDIAEAVLLLGAFLRFSGFRNRK